MTRDSIVLNLGEYNWGLQSTLALGTVTTITDTPLLQTEAEVPGNKDY